jgi:hypothetical protein
MRATTPIVALLIALVPAASAVDGDPLDGSKVNCPTHVDHCRIPALDLVDASVEASASFSAMVTSAAAVQLALGAHVDLAITITLKSNVSGRSAVVEVQVEDTEDVALLSPANQTETLQAGDSKTFHYQFVMDQGMLPGQTVVIPVKLVSEGKSAAGAVGYQIAQPDPPMVTTTTLLWGLGGLVLGGVGGTLAGRKL